MNIPATIRIVAVNLLIFLLCSVWLSTGIYSHREFGGFHLFLKHRLSTRFFFDSPVGENDRDPVSKADRQAEADYREFVELNQGEARSLTILQ